MGFWEPLFFWIFALGAFATSISVLVFRNPLYSALALILDFFCFAGLYALLSAHFLAVTQILVYAGAIMVLFVFIIMLLNLSDKELGARRFNLHHILAVLAGIGIFIFAVSGIGSLVDEKKVKINRSASAAAYTVQLTSEEITEELLTQRHERKIAQADEGEKTELRRQSGPTVPDQRPFVRTTSSVPGLYADISEYAVRATYRDQLKSWQEGTDRPSDGKYRPFDADREFELPPALRADTKAIDEQVRRRSERKQGNIFGTVEPISFLLVNRFVIPFELTAVLLLAGVIGAVIIAKKRL
jgi:NADH:ubiquinone oxidoreductase subunit 6 (subunit J)